MCGPLIVILRPWCPSGKRFVRVVGHDSVWLAVGDLFFAFVDMCIV